MNRKLTFQEAVQELNQSIFELVEPFLIKVAESLTTFSEWLNQKLVK
jgi:predicted NACHT family NTPase